LFAAVSKCDATITVIKWLVLPFTLHSPQPTLQPWTGHSELPPSQLEVRFY